jgi:hypothetical protein
MGNGRSFVRVRTKGVLACINKKTLQLFYSNFMIENFTLGIPRVHPRGVFFL